MGILTKFVVGIACSVVLGGAFGSLAAVGMRATVVWQVVAVIGAAVGLRCSPAQVFALRRGRWVMGLVSIALPTALAAYVAGRVTPPNGGPPLSLAVSALVYLLAAMARGTFMLLRCGTQPSLVRRECGYDRSGLRLTAVCPECGGAARGQ